MSTQDKIKELYTKQAEKFKKFGIKMLFEENKPLEFMAEAKLADGTIIKTTAAEWGAGADAYKIEDGGVETPLTAGEYELEGGGMLVIGEDGKVAEVREKEPVEEEMSSDAVELINALGDRVTELEAKLSEAETKNTENETELTNTRAQLSAKTLEVERLKKKASASSVTEEFADKSKPAKTDDEPKAGTKEWFLKFTEKSPK